MAKKKAAQPQKTNNDIRDKLKLETSIQFTWIQQKLKATRESRGLTLAQAGKLVGFGKIRMHVIENPNIKDDLAFSTILRLIKAYGCNPGDFLKDMPPFVRAADPDKQKAAHPKQDKVS